MQRSNSNLVLRMQVDIERRKILQEAKLKMREYE